MRIRLFASLRDAVGLAESFLELREGATAEDAWRVLAHETPSLVSRRPSLAVAVNREYAEFATVLKEGDEVAFIPPVSGG